MSLDSSEVASVLLADGLWHDVDPGTLSVERVLLTHRDAAGNLERHEEVGHQALRWTSDGVLHWVALTHLRGLRGPT